MYMMAMFYFIEVCIIACVGLVMGIIKTLILGIKILVTIIGWVAWVIKKSSDYSKKLDHAYAKGKTKSNKARQSLAYNN
jgi:hypothetical protein